MAYVITGKVLAADGTPLIRKVAILDAQTMNKVGEVYSDATGQYTFKQFTPDARMVLVKAEDADDSNSLLLDRMVPVYDGVPIAANIDKIGVRGTIGFGVGYCMDLPDGFEPLPDNGNPYSETYGNYKYTSDSSIMVWIPKFYYKWGTGSNGLALNDCDIAGTDVYADEAAANADGYALHRSFIDGGDIKDGFFIDKYKNCKHPTLSVASSLNYGYPLQYDTIAANFSLPNYFSSFIPAAKLRGNGFHCQSIFQRNALNLLSYAHGKATTDPNICAWANLTYNFPRGDTSGSPSVDINNLPLFAMRPAMALEGNGVFPFSATTHNGQANGVGGICGGSYDAVLGLSYNTDNFRVLLESIEVKTITENVGNPTDHFGASLIMENIGPTLSDFGTDTGWRYYSPATQIFSESTDRNSLGYKYTNMGIPNPGVITTTDPKYLGGGTYATRTNELFPFVGGVRDSNAGAWCLILYAYRTFGSSSFSFRSAFYHPKT